MKKNKDEIFFESTLPTLIKDLESKEREKGMYAIEVLSAHASLSMSAIPALTALSVDTDMRLSRAAKIALKKIKSYEVEIKQPD